MPKLKLALVALSALALSACVVAPYPRYAAADAGYEGPAVDVAPPAPYVEVVPVIPFAGAVWLGGYWGWHSGRHHWVQGRWDRPRAGYAWRSHAWVQFGGRWHQRGGGWHRR